MNLDDVLKLNRDVKFASPTKEMELEWLDG